MKKQEIKQIAIPVRFFLYDDINGEIDTRETNEEEFISARGKIEYERHTIFSNGVTQICLTKDNGYNN